MGDSASRLKKPRCHIVTQAIPLINLLTKSPPPSKYRLPFWEGLRADLKIGSWQREALLCTCLRPFKETPSMRTSKTLLSLEGGLRFRVQVLSKQ